MKNYTKAMLEVFDNLVSNKPDCTYGELIYKTRKSFLKKFDTNIFSGSTEEFLKHYFMVNYFGDPTVKINK
jgi:hypothetical protein